VLDVAVSGAAAAVELRLTRVRCRPLGTCPTLGWPGADLPGLAGRVRCQCAHAPPAVAPLRPNEPRAANQAGRSATRRWASCPTRHASPSRRLPAQRQACWIRASWAARTPTQAPTPPPSPFWDH
jgi:hypothetical protein